MNNREIDKLSGGQVIVSFVKSQRLRWLGHLYRMPETRIPRRMLEGRIHHRRRIGRPKLRWLDGVTKDLRIMRVRGWKTLLI
ncbi:hypothetical protein C0J52_26893 [Blattella germanica]|nr:hypothetical protein C0J52_26893 [Blattella germanica]